MSIHPSAAWSPREYFELDFHNPIHQCRGKRCGNHQIHQKVSVGPYLPILLEEASVEIEEYGGVGILTATTASGSLAGVPRQVLGVEPRVPHIFQRAESLGRAGFS